MGAAAPAYSNGHAYRHGVVPFRGHQHTVASNAPGTAAASANNLNYGGAVDGVGVTTGAEKVSLVFWGSQWGSQSTNSSGYATFSGDPSGVAPDLRAFFKGLGTGGALAGVWEDTSSAAPSAASGHALGREAENAATHLGNTTKASNRNVQYVIVSPTGTNPDNYKTQGFCAWHDFTGDSRLDGGGAVSGSLLAFTNLPYSPDAGQSCGAELRQLGFGGDARRSDDRRGP